MKDVETLRENDNTTESRNMHSNVFLLYLKSSLSSFTSAKIYVDVLLCDSVSHIPVFMLGSCMDPPFPWLYCNFVAQL